MRPRYDTRIIVLATLLFLAGIIGLQMSEARSVAMLEHAVLTLPGGQKVPVRIPLVDASRPDTAEYQIDATLPVSRLTQTVIRFVPDDCLTALRVNGQEVPLGRLSQQALCSWKSGVDIDLGRYLHPGDNAVSLRVRNIRGPWGLQLREAGQSRMAQWSGVRSLLLIVPYILAMMQGLGILRSNRRRFWVASGLIVLGAALRVVFVYVLHRPDDHVYSDMESYVDEASQMVAGDRSPSHLFHPIGYPLSIAVSRWLTGELAPAVCFQVLLGIAGLVLMWRASVRFLGEGRALWVLLIGALHFPFISMNGFFLAETDFTFFLALLFYLLSRTPFPWSARYAFALGFVYMAAAWMKGNNSLFAPLLVAWVALWAWRMRSRGLPWRAPVVRALAGFVAGACIVAAMTAAATYTFAGHARISAATGALNFVEGKCPNKINHDLSGSGWQSPLFVQLGEGGDKVWPAYFWDQSYFWKAGLSCVRADPRVILTSVRYIYYLFFDNQMWPSNSSEYADLNRWYGMLVSTVLFPGMVIGILLVSRKPLSGRRPAFLMIASLFVASWLLKSEMRYRVPFDVAIIPLAVMGWSWLVAAIFRARRRLPA